MNSWRISALADRHRALGSSLGDWNGMGTAWTYSSDLADEHEAIRTKAGLMDVSGLKKMHLVGPHAEMLINQATTRNVSKLYPGKSVYACMLNEAGKFIDDCVIYRISPNAFMVVHGAGQGHEILTRGAVGRNVAVLFDDDLHDLSLQGPLAVSFLEKFVPGVRQLPYFHHMHTTLFGAPIMLSRTGYTGERGYEIFCKAANAPKIWDTVLAEGKAMGIIPCSFTTLDWLRVESSLMFYPYDNSDMYPMEGEPIGDSLWELGLDFTVSPGKTEFRGATEHFRLQGQERFKIFGVEMQQFEAAQAGDGLWDGDKKVGFVTCAMVSRLTKKSMAIARLDPAYAVPGRALELRGAAMTSAATTASLPFDDPQKLKRTAKD
ncbi:MAG: aminomethyltransferase [Burkholderiales bacterium RIFCSPHIGHO2_02_FULL_66_10]|uniref:aminomethyltransferase family protein n=1 Tax=Hydrogenophaga sp. TaxID=1904254 RepID=UPI0008C57B15|nr:aminomethyltransferase family protein [Hydrogenophaga sp.]OGA79300.1 MAG: aminomethyltransferase [Burkholderiales bacterium GWE1_65_30]OGA92191.1 MAG: aminomethyltransferase [Burkholderiales bacterium GWF1_66_17]OGB15811.1 MAG: aminomethyltransferase [Burkholderiales bacterium RIFCSPHIGHO2_02_FULL_66_10]HBU17901.1 aminomethyltransferase [Hydrogenophaga sp.]